MSRKLTGKKADFVAFLPKMNWVGTDAVIAAGYKVKNRQSASEISSQLLKKAQVREAIDRIMDERLRKAGIYAEKVLMELGKIGFSDISQLYAENGSLKLPKKWPEELKGVIAGVETFEEFSGKGNHKKLTGYTKKVRTYDKVKALDLLGKYLKLFPIERRGEGDESKDIPILPSNLELSAKIFYIVELAIKKQNELEQAKQKQINGGK